MLELESLWLRTIINKIKIEQDVNVLNFGSQSLQALKYQPYMHQNVIVELKMIGATVINFDIKEGEGIDISGDIFDYSIFRKLKGYDFSCILLLNVLEHVTDVQKFCDKISDLMVKGNKIIITVPYDFPCHFDPIDNGLRPNVEELISLFPNLSMIHGEILTDYKYTYYLLRYWRTRVKFLLRIMSPFYKYYVWKKCVITKVPYLFRRFKVTCVVLEKR